MKKKKKYCAQRHLDGNQVKHCFLHDAYRLQDEASEGCIKIASMNFYPLLYLVSVSADAQGYFPHKGWGEIRNSCFQGKFIAWISEFSVTINGSRENMLAVYKVKNGKRLLIKKEDVQTGSLPFCIGAYHFAYKKGSDLLRYTAQRLR